MWGIYWNGERRVAFMRQKFIRCYKEHPILTVTLSVGVILLTLLGLYYLGYGIGKMFAQISA